VPITVAAGAVAVAVVGVALSLVTRLIPAVREAMFPLVLAAGVAMFVFAMCWDLSDRERRLRQSDVAFWLHLAAAPMIAHTLSGPLGVFDNKIGIGIAAVVLVLYVAFTFVALAANRRALLVSSLAYVLYAHYALFQSAGSVELAWALTGLVLGSALLTLSAFWQTMRRVVVGTPVIWQRAAHW
jgi:hypothetical protein